MKVASTVAVVLFLIATVAYAQVNKDKPWQLEDTWPMYIQNHPLVVEANDNESTRLLKRRFNTTLEELRHRYTYWEMGEGQIQDVFANSERLESARESLPDGIGRPATLNKQKIDFAKYMELRADPQKRPSPRKNIYFAEAKSAEAFRLSIEIDQLK